MYTTSNSNCDIVQNICYLNQIKMVYNKDMIISNRYLKSRSVSKIS